MRSNLHVYKWLLLNSTLFCTGFFPLRDLWKEEVFHKCSLETLPVPPEMIQRQAEQQFIASLTTHTPAAYQCPLYTKRARYYVGHVLSILITTQWLEKQVTKPEKPS